MGGGRLTKDHALPKHNNPIMQDHLEKGPIMTVGVMTKLGAGQKEQIFWDTECPEEIVKAEARFQELVSAGYTAVKKEAGENGSSTDVQTKSFDETSPEIIMVPRLVGG